jgi:hypothetical protein
LQQISTVADELPLDVKGRSIVIPQENGERIRARVMDIQDDYLTDPSKDKTYLDSLSPQEREDFLAQHTKFTIRYDKTEQGKAQREEILTYQQIMDYLDDDQKSERVWKFKELLHTRDP